MVLVDTEVEINKAIVENDHGEQAIKGTLCTDVVSDAGWVTIKGNPDDLYFFNASGNEIDQIQFNDNLKLQVLNLEHNNLKSLNIDRLQSLNIIYLQDNPFSATTPLMIGRMPNLMVLEVPQIGISLQTLRLRTSLISVRLMLIILSALRQQIQQAAHICSV